MAASFAIFNNARDIALPMAPALPREVEGDFGTSPSYGQPATAAVRT
jgi:hypothetical protein